MIAVYASMKLQHLVAACHLVKVVDILCDHSLEFACLFELCEFQMCGVRSGSITEHLVTVEFIKFIRMTQEKGMA